MNRFVNPWHRAPLLRLLLPFLLGVICALNIELELQWLPCLWLPTLIHVLSWKYLAIQWRYRLRSLPGIGIVCLYFCLGAMAVISADTRRAPAYINNIKGNAFGWVVEILEDPLPGARSAKSLVKVRACLRQDGLLEKATGKIMLYWSLDSRLPGMGECVLIQNRLESFAPNGNPGAFEYKDYMALRRVYHQQYIPTKKWRLVSHANPYKITWQLNRVKSYCLQVLRKYIPGKQVGLAEALLLGYRADLARSAIAGYAGTGIIHIIAISGLHLGLIYLSLLKLLTMVLPGNRGRILKGLIIIIILWLFSLITGGSPSVLRSALMFSLVVTGKFWVTRRGFIFNTLAASAFFLVLYEPYYLLNVGFQLSYIAVLSILLFQPVIAGLWKPKLLPMKKIWELISVTLAAQVGTLPICLFYFHQFPLYFLPANLLSIPAATIILYSLLLLMLCSWMPFAAKILGMISGNLIQYFDTYNQLLYHLPAAVIENIRLDRLGLFISIFLVIFLLLAWKYTLRWAAWSCLYCILALIGNLRWKQYLEAHQRKFIIYNCRDALVMDLISGSDAFTNRVKEIPASVVQARKALGIRKLTHINNFAFNADGLKVLVINSTFTRPSAGRGKKVELDYIVITRGAKLHMEALTSVYTCKMIIFDSRLHIRQVEKWKSECNKLTLRNFSIQREGAFVINF